MTDERSRALERRLLAGDDAAAAPLFEALVRQGHLDPALERLQTEESALLALLRALPLAEGRTRVRLAVGPAGRGDPGFTQLLAAWFPAFARIASVPEIARFVAAHALSNAPIRLSGRSDGAQLVVTWALHALARPGPLLVRWNHAVGPQGEMDALEDELAARAWRTVLIFGLSHSHYSRLEARAIELGRDRRSRTILGIRRDAWDAEQFRPFTLGPELETPAIAEPEPVHVQEALRSLLVDAGLPDASSPDVDRALGQTPGDASWKKLCCIAGHAVYLSRADARAPGDAAREAVERYANWHANWWGPLGT